MTRQTLPVITSLKGELRQECRFARTDVFICLLHLVVLSILIQKEVCLCVSVLCVCMHACVHCGVCVYVCVCVCVHTCEHAGMCACMHVCHLTFLASDLIPLTSFSTLVS